MGQVANCFTGSQPHNLHASCCMLTWVTVAYTSTPTGFFFCFLWLAIIFFLILFGSFISLFYFNYYQMKIALLLRTSLDHRIPLLRELLNIKIVASYGSRCFVEKRKKRAMDVERMTLLCVYLYTLTTMILCRKHSYWYIKS